MKKLVWLLGMVCCLSLSLAAQQIDAAFGVRSLMGNPASDATGDYFPQYVGGGAYPTFSADYLFKHHFGVGGEISWRASQAVFQGFQPYRPLFYDFNGIWAPRISNRVSPELMAGLGAESLRIYQQFTTCSFTSCTNYTSTNHFMGHFGAGLRLYVHGNAFIRPEAHLYLIHNNFEFAGPRANSFGVSLGYSFRPSD